MELQNILWDFDGVILDSMEVRDIGFEKIFKDYPLDKVNKLIDYHRINGGLSRYVKIRYFYEEILGEEISDEKVTEFANLFSEIMRTLLIDKKRLIEDSVTFIKDNHKNYNFHIVSGSDQKELRYLCKELDVAGYFISINGSPTAKTVLVENLINEHGYSKEQTCLIGDSINDLEAAEANQINFIGYNNKNLNDGLYIDKFESTNLLNKY